MQYTLSSDDGFLIAKTSGDADLLTLNAMVLEIVRHPQWTKHGQVLVDHSDLNSDTLSSEHLRKHVQRNASVRNHVGNARVALLVARTLEFGMVRMWEGLVSSNWDATTMCFTVREEAIAWLKQGRAT